MIINLTENQSYDLKFLEQYQCSTAGNKITFHQELSPADITAIEAHINEMTQAERDFDNAKKAKLQEANSECEKALSVITSQYSNAERETWVIQELEASNFQHDVDNLVEPKRPTPNLDWIIEEKDGLPVDDIKRQALVTRILTKAALFHQQSSLAVGRRHKMTEAVEAATTIEELNGITY